jgi:hypothetical protein
VSDAHVLAGTDKPLVELPDCSVLINITRSREDQSEAFVDAKVHRVVNASLSIPLLTCFIFIDEARVIHFLVFVQSRVAELASGLGMRHNVHPLCRQWQSTPIGKLRYEFCMLYSQLMAIALTEATRETTHDNSLDEVFTIMRRYMRRHTPP